MLGRQVWLTTAVQASGEVRRLACTAQILPAVLDGDSEVLDLGRTRRLFSPRPKGRPSR